MAEHITIVQASLATVQDLGRVGLESTGIPVNGAADQHSASVANILVGNQPNDPLIEITATDFAFEASCPLLVSITGAPADITVGPHSQRQWEPLCVAAGDRVSVHRIHDGVRTYVAVGGALQTISVLGSCAPDSLLQIGQPLVPGTRLRLDTTYQPFDHPVFRHPIFAFDPPVPRFGCHWIVPVTAGPDLADFDNALTQLCNSTYTIGARSNHIGLRLEGPVPQRNTASEVLSRGVPIGAVEVPPANGLLLLQRGRPITAGYPVIAVATRVAQSALGQAAPGHTLQFTPTSLADAVAAHQTQVLRVATLAQRVHNAFTALDLPMHVSQKGHPHVVNSPS